MAAYGALLSLSHLLHQILHPPPLYNFIIDRQQIEFLQGRIELLINFLETYPSRRSEEIADLEARIRDAAYEAEDIIESNAVDQIQASSFYRRVKISILSSKRKRISTLLSRTKKIATLLPQRKKISTNKFLEKFLSIEKELLSMRVVQGMRDLQLKSSAAATSSRSPLPGGKITMVGFDDHLIQIMSELASNETSRQIIPIVGMGGIGKTTLATAIYNSPFIVEHFHVRVWVTVSQEYNVRELLLRLLYEIHKSYPDKQEYNDNEIGLQLHKELFGRKYLIVMDDMWDIHAWEEVKKFLPHNENGSRVLVTSRLSNLVNDFGSCAPYKMDFLDEGHSWDLFRKTIFVEEDCPIELEEIGKDIVKRCRGLPLAIVLISGLLSKSDRTKEKWSFFAKDMTSALNFGNDEQMMKILLLSYTHLPVHLKPCFLNLAMFPEDSEIHVSTLIRLWVAERLIKSSQDKCLEELALEYLEDLVSRNVILVGTRGSRGNVKSCKLHDLVRDLCITQAEKEKFAYIAKLDNPNISPNIDIERRLSVSATRTPFGIKIKALQSASLNRSWVSPEKLCDYRSFSNEKNVSQIINDFRLLKVVHENDGLDLIELLNLSNLRYVYTYSVHSVLPMALCWNLQTLLLSRPLSHDLPHEIWLMPQLRHLKIYSFTMPDPPDDGQNIVLENLQTIKGVKEFKCSEHVLIRIPNLKRLRVVYSSKASGAYEQDGNFCLHNLASFEKLESLGIFYAEKLWPTIAFPISLKKLTLRYCWIPWEDLSIVGWLHNLEVLKLDSDATKGEEWNPIEGQFCRLKFLLIWSCELKIWGAENIHFPCLKHLFLKKVELEMIPISFSEILTLQLIDLEDVNDSVWASAREISNEREQLGYEPLQLQI